MSEVTPQICDNKSVGVIIENDSGAFALLRRARFPIGIAPPAGHLDSHGSLELAAVNEAREESGLIISVGGLKRTAIYERRVNNQCRRLGGDHHDWTVFETDQFGGELQPSPDEAKSAGWYDPPLLQELADRTRAFQAGQISPEDWVANPGLEEIWADFFHELGYVV
jgi:8-oxo-dGTP pyrophosphatase MutT (NUDIX family)